ncbi:D-amino-acid transaminase [Atopococcus tabaci]|uniref:D-amino-acid transaminase n=1 Tax=Atopococcus tabaci TaxID=269774 RepID=UPI00240909DE|nr:D-amino-acid transaminase [Atopococcus tabaci]
MKVLWNKNIVDREQVRIEMEDRGYQFGDGIYEVIRAYNGTYFGLDEHIDRLFKSADKIELMIPYERKELKEVVTALLDINHIHTGDLYLQITRGISSPRNHLFPEAGVEPIVTGSLTVAARDTEKMKKGIAVSVEKDERWLKCDIKSTSLLGNVLAKHEAYKKNAEEAVLHRDGIVTECSSANLAVIKEGTVYTHPDGNLILAGITKLMWLQCAKEIGLPVREEAFTLEELYAADEIFCSSTTKEIMPIVKVDDQAVGDGVPGTWTKKLQQQYVAMIEKACGALV